MGVNRSSDGLIEFIQTYGTPDGTGGVSIKVTQSAGVDNELSPLTLGDPAGGRMLKIKIIGGGGGSSITVVANYSALPAPATVSGEFYWCSASQGTWWLPGSLGGTYYNSGLYYSNGVSWEYMETPYQATQAQVDAGTADDVFVSPLTLENAAKFGNFVPYTGATGNVDIGAYNLLAAQVILNAANLGGAILDLHNIGDGLTYNANLTKYSVGLPSNPNYTAAYIEVVMDGTNVGDGRFTIITEGQSTANFKYGKLGIENIDTPTAFIHIPAVSASANTAPIKLTLGGTLMTTPEAGAIEAINTHIYWTDSAGNRYQLDQQGSGTVNSGTQYRLAYYAATGTAVSEASAITASRALKSDANGVPTHFDTTTEPSLTELTYLKGATSAIQTQINTKSPTASPTFTGTVTTPAIIVSSETASRVAIIDGSKNVKSADTSTYPSLTELAYLKGVTSNIQTQIAAITPCYTIGIATGNQATIADSTTYFFGGQWASALSTSANVGRIYFPKTGTIKRVLIWCWASGTAGSNENWTMNIRLNDTTDTAIATLGSTAAYRLWSNVALSIAVTEIIDYVEIKTTTPAWATNPTALRFGGVIYVE